MARYTLIPEKGYATVMNQMIVPGLKPFHESGTLEVSPGHPIRWDYYSCPDARGSIIISHGFIESGFKFIEMVYYFRQMGLNVCTVTPTARSKTPRRPMLTGFMIMWMIFMGSLPRSS